MRILLTILICTSVQCFGAESSLYDFLSGVVQGSGQKNGDQQEKKSEISYSEAAYYMAEGAAVTTAVCLPTIFFVKIFGFEQMGKDESCPVNDSFVPMCLALVQTSPGCSWSLRYSLKAYNSRQSHAVKKEYNSQSNNFTVEPLARQDIVNAHAKSVGSIMALIGVGLAVCVSLND